MTVARLNRLEGDRFASAEPTCATCLGCGSPVRTVVLPGIKADRLALTLAGRGLLVVLFNSLLLPLFILLTVAITCRVLAVAEPHAIVLSVLGLVIGVALCRKQPATLIEVEEVS